MFIVFRAIVWNNIFFAKFKTFTIVIHQSTCGSITVRDITLPVKGSMRGLLHYLRTCLIWSLAILWSPLTCLLPLFSEHSSAWFSIKVLNLLCLVLTQDFELLPLPPSSANSYLFIWFQSDSHYLGKPCLNSFALKLGFTFTILTIVDFYLVLWLDCSFPSWEYRLHESRVCSFSSTLHLFRLAQCLSIVSFSLLLCLGKNIMKLFISNYYRKIDFKHTQMLVVTEPTKYRSSVVQLYLIPLAVSPGFVFPLASKLLSSCLDVVVLWGTSSTACILHLINAYWLPTYSLSALL